MGAFVSELAVKSAQVIGENVLSEWRRNYIPIYVKLVAFSVRVRNAIAAYILYLLMLI